METMYAPQNNGPHTTLMATINASNTDITVADASVLPSAPNVLTIGLGEDAELVLVSAVTGNVLTVTRAYNGTTAKVWNSGDWIYRAVTAQDIAALQSNVTALDSAKQPKGNYLTEVPDKSVSSDKLADSLKAIIDGKISEETDPNVPAWAREATKPTYTASEVGAAEESHTQAASTITAGTLGGRVQASAAAAGALTSPQVRDIIISTTDLTAGTSALSTGTVYFVYE